MVEFVQHISKQKFNDYEIILVNNGSNQINLLESLAQSYPVTIVDSNENKGYLGGAEFGLTTYLNQNKELPSHLIVCNTDIIFGDDLFLSKLYTLTDDVIGPTIISSKTRLNQNPFYTNRISDKKLKFLKLIFSAYPLYVGYQLLSVVKNSLSLKKIDAIKDNSKKVYAIHGSFMIFNKSYFEKGGNFNYGSFLYGEEIYIAELARINCMSVTYHSSLKIIHQEHSTTGLFKKPLHVKYMSQSINYLLNRFFS